jgi:hypothetical protein
VNRSVVTAIVMILGATAGCGRHASRLSGRISLDGKPLTTGVITLTPVGEGPSAYAAIGVDGRYSIHTGAATGLDPGEYVVARKSPLRARVEPGSQELDFELQSR